jgi:hypothetical protein
MPSTLTRKEDHRVVTMLMSDDRYDDDDDGGDGDEYGDDDYYTGDVKLMINNDNVDVNVYAFQK